MHHSVFHGLVDGERKELKIAMVSTWRTRCGIADYTYNLSKALADLDVEVYIIRIPRFGRRTNELTVNIAENIPFDKIDITHVQHEYNFFQGTEAAFYNVLRVVGKPVVTTMHATGVMWNSDKTVSENSLKVIVHNKHMAEKFRLPCEIIAHGCLPYHPCVDKIEARKILGIQPDVPVVGYCGFISNYKGLETLVEAVKRVPNVGLLIAGGWHTTDEPDYIMALKQKTIQDLPSRCQWTGFVEDERLATVYGAMDFMVYPARMASESGAMLMAMSYGKAVVASDLVPYREKEPYIMIFKDVDHLTEIIKMLIDKPLQIESYENTSKQYIDENSWSSVARRHIQLYEECLSLKK